MTKIIRNKILIIFVGLIFFTFSIILITMRDTTRNLTQRIAILEKRISQGNFKHGN